MDFTDYGNMSSDNRVLRAKTQMYDKSPFFSYILLHMKFIKMDDEIRNVVKRMMCTPTMGVDPNGNCYWDKDFVMSISGLELLLVIAHEVLHVALLHCDRLGTRDPIIANYAQDLVVNSILMHQDYQDDPYSSSKMYKLPEKCLVPDNKDCWEFKSNGKSYTIEKISEKSWEEIYEEIIKHIPKFKMMAMYSMGTGDGQGESDSDGQGGDGDSKDDSKGKGAGKDLSKEEKEEAKKKLKAFDGHIFGDKDLKEKSNGNGQNRKVMERQQGWKSIVAEAASLAKTQGKLPAGLARLVEDILDSKINWKQIMYRFVVAQLPFDYTWRRPHKRGSALGIYLPDVVRESLHIIFHIDTSGSMSRDELEQALGELQAILEAFNNVNIDVLIGDAEMQNTFKLTSENVGDIIDIADGMKGGGGTDHIYVYKYVLEHIPDAKILICYTDGFTDFPEDSEEYPFETMWVLTKSGCPVKDVPFGEVIKIDR